MNSSPLPSPSSIAYALAMWWNARHYEEILANELGAQWAALEFPLSDFSQKAQLRDAARFFYNGAPRCGRPGWLSIIFACAVGSTHGKISPHCRLQGSASLCVDHCKILQARARRSSCTNLATCKFHGFPPSTQLFDPHGIQCIRH